MKKLLSVVLLGLLAACATEKAKEPVAETKSAPTAAAKDDASATTGAASSADTSSSKTVDPLNDPASPLAKRSVYFPFDVDAIQSDDKATIQAHGKYLSEHPGAKVRVEGNADERGSTEYNLALGQRRANNTKKALVLSGAKAAQIETVSYGEEKPRCTDHNESCWAQNRRADISYK